MGEVKCGNEGAELVENLQNRYFRCAILHDKLEL